MVLLSLLTGIILLIVAGVTRVSMLSGVGVLLFFCIAAIICVLCGLGMLIKLLGKGVFSLLKCVIFLILMLVPAINIIALIALCIICIRSLRNN